MTMDSKEINIAVVTMGSKAQVQSVKQRCTGHSMLHHIHALEGKDMPNPKFMHEMDVVLLIADMEHDTCNACYTWIKEAMSSEILVLAMHVGDSADKRAVKALQQMVHATLSFEQHQHQGLSSLVSCIGFMRAILQTLNVSQDLTFSDLQGFFGLHQHISISHHTATQAKQKEQLLCQIENEAEHRYAHATHQWCMVGGDGVGMGDMARLQSIITAPLHDDAEVYFSIHRQSAVFFECWIAHR